LTLLETARDTLADPVSVAVDGGGVASVAGRTSDVFSISSDGVITQILDFSGDDQGHFSSSPNSVAVDEYELYLSLQIVIMFSQFRRVG